MVLRGLLRRERRYLLASLIVSRILGSKSRIRGFEPTNILVIKLDELGDMVLSTHVFSLLKRDYPRARVTVLCKPFVKALIEHHPDVDEVLTDVSMWTKRYDTIIDLRGTWQTLRKTLLLRPHVRLDQAPVRWRNMRANTVVHEAQTHADIVAPILKNTSWMQPTLATTAADRNIVHEFTQQHMVQTYAVLAPGARSALRRWPLTRYAELAQWLYAEYGLTSICAGGPEDQASIHDIVHASNGSALQAPADWSLSTFIALCEGASLFVGNESGPMHIASTFNIPLVGIYGPGIPKRFDVLGSRSQIVHHVLPCNPCDQIHCVHPDNPCIARASLAEVQHAVRTALTHI